MGTPTGTARALGEWPCREGWLCILKKNRHRELHTKSLVGGFAPDI